MEYPQKIFGKSAYHGKFTIRHTGCVGCWCGFGEFNGFPLVGTYLIFSGFFFGGGGNFFVEYLRLGLN